MHPWEPLVAQSWRGFEPFVSGKADEPREPFVSGDGGKMTQTVFVGVGLMLLGIVSTILFVWAYSRDKMLFIAALSLLMFAFAANVLVYFAAFNRQRMGDAAYKYYVGLSSFVAFATLINAIIFGTQYMRRSRMP